MKIENSDCHDAPGIVSKNPYRGTFEVRCRGLNNQCPTFTWSLTEEDAIKQWNDAMIRLKWRRRWV